MIRPARRRARYLLPCGILLALAGVCVARDAVREYVDETSAVHVTVAADALVFARERSDLAANARDYVTLTPLEINRMGERHCFWLGYVWSTIDRRGAPILASGEQLVLLADGRPLRLVADSIPLNDRGVIRSPLPAPRRDAQAVLFTADPETIAYAARADQLRIELVRADGSESFELWQDARASLRAFAERIGAN